MMYGTSVFATCPADPSAYVFTPEAFGACPDGRGDNAAALQKAADMIAERDRRGILFVPQGSYRFAETVQLWRGIRLIGFGRRRPVFFLSDGTPGYGGPGTKYILHFRDMKPQADYPLRDGQNTSFYGGVRNIDFDLGRGNPGAAACRYRIAQLCSLEDIDFTLNDAYAAVEMVGNEIERCRFFGGEFGIVTGETVPYWPFYLGDCVFEGQRRACVSSYRAGLTMVRDTLRGAPYGVFVPNKETDNHYTEEYERLYMEDCRLEDISLAGVSMNMTRYPQNWLHARGTLCRNTPVFYEPFGSRFNHHVMVGPVGSDLPCYSVEMDMGLRIRADGGGADRRFDLDAALAPAAWSPAPGPGCTEMPPPEECVSIRDLGAAGDGVTDDTAVFEQAIARYRAIYLPMGTYRLTRGLVLRQDTALVGLHCFRTRLQLDDGCPGFGDPARPRALLTAPKGGHNHVCGISFDGGRNPGLTAVEWLAAPDSVLEDILFVHAGRMPAGRRERNVGGQSAAPPPERKGQDRLHTLWIRDGGAGVFKNIWSPDVWAREGILISDTDAPGRMYLVSVEHHAACEMEMRNAANWRLAAVQTEEELGSENACSLRLSDCRDVEFVNLFQYRVQAIEDPYPYAGYADRCRNLRVLGQHVFSIGPAPFASAFLVDGKTEIRDHEIGTLIISG